MILAWKAEKPVAQVAPPTWSAPAGRKCRRPRSCPIPVAGEEHSRKSCLLPPPACSGPLRPLRLTADLGPAQPGNRNRRPWIPGRRSADIAGPRPVVVVVPGQQLHGTIRVPLEATRTAPHHRQILPLRHFALPHSKPPADGHRCLRAFRVLSAHLVRRTTHPERSRREEHPVRGDCKHRCPVEPLGLHC